MGNVKKADRRAPVEALFCVVCKEPIPAKRLLQKAVTCSKDHATILKNERRRRRNLERCQFCNRPCSPEELALFRAWRATLPQAKRGRPPKPKPQEVLVNGADVVEDRSARGEALQEERNGISRQA